MSHELESEHGVINQLGHLPVQEDSHIEDQPAEETVPSLVPSEHSRTSEQEYQQPRRQHRRPKVFTYDRLGSPVCYNMRTLPHHKHLKASGGENRGQHILYTGPEAQAHHFTLFTSDCSAIHSTNTIVKFASYRTMMRPNYREEIQHLTQWCSNNNLVLNTSKTKEVIVDYRRSRRTEHAPLLIHGEAVERVNNIKFLGIHITI
ncbi:hypothetical protein L3Q82_007789 [Scortum barcoo]|uniref:Uncharacterized protein n=1 Tax=Scortum barcoo TaxID=214431 RepID=A0ACB8WNE7_9TELE|nr:hypothetical protein L3Q82_007789 [Scortum barcoo]